MKNNILTLLIVFFSLTLSAQEVNWISFEKAIELNKKEKKFILLDVYTDWCGWCKRMDKTTYKNKVIVEYINKHFYAVKLDGEGKKDIVYKEYTFKYKEKGRSKFHELPATILNGKLSYPTTVVLDKNEKLLDRIPGYLDAKTMEKVINYFAQEKYKSEKWDVFVKKFKSKV
jgi:thioredoxin-related protein